MNKQRIGFLHPGAMGISLAATAKNTGHTAYWVSENRSLETRERAEKHGLVEVRRIEELCDICSTIISVCPPHAAIDVAKQVLKNAFKGTFVDANAISPQRVRSIGELMNNAGVPFVDGGIIGGPAWKQGTTWLYLSGSDAREVTPLFSGGPLATEVVGDTVGKASALKMCYAAYTKGTTALLCTIVAAAEKMGVREELEQQWSWEDPGFTQNTLNRISRVTAKAWRFSGEMKEIATTIKNAGLPNGFHLAAHEIYERIALFKDQKNVPEIEEIIVALLKQDISTDT